MSAKMSPRLKKILWGAGLLVMAAVGIWLLMTYYPAYHRYFPPCPFYRLTHLYCPGCGNTRALFCLLHGNLAGAFRCNAMLIPSLCFLYFLICRRRRAIPPAVLWTFAALILAFWILRNIPCPPFDLLAPPPMPQ